MSRKIVRDIEVRKKILPSPADDSPVLQRPEEKSVTLKKIENDKSPFVLDLSQENVVHAGGGNADIRMIQPSGQGTPTFVVQKKISPRMSLIIQLATIALAGVLILLVLYAARGLAASRKLFSEVAQNAKNGYQEIIQAGANTKQDNIAGATTMFEQAYASFQQAQAQIWFIKNDQTLSKYTSVLESGRLLAESGKDMSDLLERLKNLPNLFAQTLSEVSEIRVPNESPILIELKKTSATLAKIHTNILTAQQNIKDVANLIPAAYTAQLEKGMLLLQTSDKILTEISQMLPGLIEMFGSGGSHRTLVLLQNNDEVRPTGGFIGSFLNLEMNSGYVTSLKLEDVYDMDGQFQEFITPPTELQSITQRWFFRDSNYSPDFTISGAKAIWFYEKERGEKADTVIAVSQDLLGKILEITGPIDVPSLSAPMTSSNYREALTYMIETKRTGAQDPKKILKDMLPLIQRRLFQSANMSQLFDTLLQEVVNKNILGYSKNSLTQNLFQTLGADGTLERSGSGIASPAPDTEDYLSVSTTSVSGNKSDAYITQELTHNTVIEKNGDTYDQLTIRRTHTWNAATEKKWKTLLKPFNFLDFPEHFYAIFGKGENKVILRAYIPNGSELLPIENTLDTNTPTTPPVIQHDADLDRDYVELQMTTKPGQTSTSTIRYKLPFQLDNLLANTYALTVQKQLGARPSQLTKHISFYDYMSLAETFPSDFVKESDGSLTITKRLSRDTRLAILFTRESLLKKK